MLVEQEATLETCKAILPCESVRCSIIASSTTTADIRLDADIAIADLVSVTDCFTPAVPSVKDAGRHTVIFNHLSVDEFLSHHTVVWEILCLLCVRSFVCTVTDFSAAENDSGAKLCMLVRLLSGMSFCHYGELWLA